MEVRPYNRLEGKGMTKYYLPHYLHRFIKSQADSFKDFLDENLTEPDLNGHEWYYYTKKIKAYIKENESRRLV